jgi:hypothetical protein
MYRCNNWVDGSALTSILLLAPQLFLANDKNASVP